MTDDPTSKAEPVACPERRCIGWVVEVDPEVHLLGCGQCGAVWPTRAALDVAISAAVKAFSHRKTVYRKVNEGWEPVARLGIGARKDYMRAVKRER